MARRRISVDKIKEVIRYGVTTELSERAIGRALKVSRTAVTKYLECFRGSGLTWEQAQELPDSELLSVLEGNRMARTSARYERLAERFPMSMHIDHKAGEKLFVDYAGDKLAIVDPDSGKEQPVETFVAILGASELTYVDASATQQGEDWIRSNERALRYCGGGPQVIVPDNLRSAVSRSDPYEPGINATFDAFAQEMPTMTNNQATLHKLDQMRLHGMARALRTSLDSQGQWTADELLAHLVDAECDDRHERRLKRLLKAARFRYPAAIEEVDFALRRNLDQNQLLRLADCRWVGQHQDLIITGKCGSGKSFLASALGGAGPSGVSARVPGRLPCVLAAVRRTAPGQGRRQLRPGAGQDQQAGTADHRRFCVGAAGRPGAAGPAGDPRRSPRSRLDLDGVAATGVVLA